MFFFLCKDSLILKNAGLMEGLHDVFLQILKLFLQILKINICFFIVVCREKCSRTSRSDSRECCCDGNGYC